MNTRVLTEFALPRLTLFAVKRLALLFVISSFTRLSAQVPPPETVEQRRFSTAPEFDSSIIRFRQSAEVGTLELVQRAPVPDTFTVHTSQRYYHTDNLFLTVRNSQHANAWNGTLGLSCVPYSTYRWTPRFTVEGTLVRFDSASRVDYNTQTIAFDNRLGLTEDNLLDWNVSVSALRSEGERAGLGEFYKRVLVVNNLNWFLPLDRAGRWLLHVSPGVTWRSAHPWFEDRLDTGAIVSLLWFPNRSIAFEPIFEGGYAYYPNDSPRLLDRRDVHLRGGVNWLWFIGNRASVAASAGWLGNYSSAAGGDYQILPEVAVTVRFGF